MSVSRNLCQTGAGTCGACCGLYNFRDHSKQLITAELRRHTDALVGVERTRDAFVAKAAELKATAPSSLFPLVRVCPLLGFLDDESSRVGCLAHPAVIGTDLRDCGVYTSEICESFTCPSYIWLDDEMADLIKAACPDWYVYGLVVTDVEFVRAVLSLLVEALARPVAASELLRTALPQTSALFALKAYAPGRSRDGRVFGRFEDAGGEDPKMRLIDYERFDTKSSREDLIVLCLGYAPETAAELQAARALVASHLSDVANALSAGAPPDAIGAA
jgi:hypothetical protein